MIRLLSILKSLSWNLKRFLKIFDVNVTQILRSFVVWYSLHVFFHLRFNNFLNVLLMSLFLNKMILFFSRIICRIIFVCASSTFCLLFDVCVLALSWACVWFCYNVFSQKRCVFSRVFSFVFLFAATSNVIRWMIFALRRLKINKKSFWMRRKQCVNSVFTNEWDFW